MAERAQGQPVYGLMAEYRSPQALLDAILRTKGEGYTAIDAFTPYPVEAVSEEIENHKKSKVSLLVLLGGLAGAATPRSRWDRGAFLGVQPATAGGGHADLSTGSLRGRFDALHPQDCGP